MTKKTQKIAIQGVIGANGHEAALAFFGENIQIVPCDISEQVFESLEKELADVAFLPIENSIVGNVTLNMDLIHAHQVTINGEYYHPIVHCLLANPKAKMEQIKKVYSHPVALAQCRDFLQKHSLEAIVDYDTAGAAMHVAKRGKFDEAAIAPSLCQSLYGLQVLNNQIQKVAHNITRFWALTKKECSPQRSGQKKAPHKTSLVLSTGHKPGALLHCLQIFKNHSVNLAKLESRPVPEDPFTYVFFIDFIGDPQDENIARCINELKIEAKSLNILGHYPLGSIPKF